ncbi:hypothetical protein F3Y22_tig00116959pilonHSYRG00161 [Hibiscus syriacus]|uniref:Barwin domain-containing protein n=1 Tax=Hibiscus syriacus TaxID=106335 RepID=A0A6A2WKR2_HIBSY|nr:wheatwin-2-like [Hibiscus syriacus]KAE8659978.1 hypothetical protein F3Y22_tig00116959pilonHSYRG00161 [Hibiscus syriacus]
MGRSVMSIGLLVLGCLVCSAAACEPTEPGTGENNVQARLVDFMPNQNNWNYPDYAACIDLDGNKPIEWRQRYGWASFCGRVGPRGRNSCGCCIKVTNSETGESVTVRVIHTCGGEAMD